MNSNALNKPIKNALCGLQVTLPLLPFSVRKSCLPAPICPRSQTSLHSNIFVVSTISQDHLGVVNPLRSNFQFVDRKAAFFRPPKVPLQMRPCPCNSLASKPSVLSQHRYLTYEELSFITTIA